MMMRQDHDRIPRCDDYWPETIERWRNEGMTGDPHEHLGSDIRGICWAWPKPFPGREQMIAEDSQTRTVINDQGNTVRLSKQTSTTPEHIAFGCTTRELWYETYRPALLSASSTLNLEWSTEQRQLGRERRQWLCLRGIEPVTGVHQLVGDEIAMIAEASDPDWVIDMATVFTDLILRDFERITDTDQNLDGMWIYGDLACNHGPFFSPQMYEQLFAPQHRRMVDWAHARDLKVVYHTDGDFRLLFDAMLATGIDCLQPLEAKAGLDLAELVPAYGKRVSFLGNIDMTIASTNNLDQLEDEVCSKLTAGMASQGYGYHSDHSVPPDVSWSTYQYLISLLDRYGLYI